MMDLLREKSNACFAASPEMSRVTLKEWAARDNPGGGSSGMPRYTSSEQE